MPKFFPYIFSTTAAPVPARTSTTDPLAANATWTSVAVPADGRSTIVGSVFANKVGQLYIEQSSDQQNWDVSTEYDVPASDGKGFSEDVLLDFVRVRYVNGSTPSTQFRLSFSVK